MLLICSPLVLLISTRFCQLSSRKITLPCHEPQLVQCHVGLRVLLPGPAPGATKLLLLALGAAPAASQSIFPAGHPGDAAGGGQWICPLTAPGDGFVLGTPSCRVSQNLPGTAEEISEAPAGTLGWVILCPGCEEGLAALPGAGMGMGVGLGAALWSHRDLEGEKYKGRRGDTERGDVKLLSMSNGVKVRSLLNTSLSFLDSKFSMVSD